MVIFFDTCDGTEAHTKIRLLKELIKKGERQMRYYDLDFEWDWDYNPEEVEEVWDKYYD